MKLLIVILLLITSVVYGQKVQPKIAVDFFPREYHLTFQNPMNNSVFSVDHGDFRTRLGAEFTYKKASAYFDQHIYMDYAGGAFDPTQAYWYVGVTYKWKFFNFKAEHLCVHPISTYSNQWRTKYYGGYNMISVSYGY